MTTVAEFNSYIAAQYSTFIINQKFSCHYNTTWAISHQLEDGAERHFKTRYHLL